LRSLLKKYNGKIIDFHKGSDYHLDTKNIAVKTFLDLYQQHLGESPKQVVADGSSDARFFAERNIPVIMLRPDGGGAHGDNEWISETSMQKFYILLRDFTQSIATI